MRRGLARVAGFSAIAGAVVFFSGVALQQASGWFPSEALATGDLVAWASSVDEARSLAMVGVWLSLAGIVAFGLFAWSGWELLREGCAWATVSMAGYSIGVPVAFAAFSLGLATTWQMEAPGGGAMETTASLLRIFLVGDDLATLLIIGLGNGAMAVAAFHAGVMGRALVALALVSGGLWALYLLAYVVPALAFGVVGAPLGLLWVLLAGIAFLRRARSAPEV